jgi:predicted anti-sigma-YlaC factor YlaD
VTCQQLVELVSDYLEDRLATEERERFEDHLGLCADCRAYVEQMRATLRALGRLPEESLSPAARDGLLEAFRTWQP